MSEVREPVTLRLKPDDKAFWMIKAEEAGLEHSIAARQLVEVAIRYMRATGADFIDTVKIVKDALK